MYSRWDDPEDEVEQLLLNARLRDELEPYLDESIVWIDTGRMPTRRENEFLASMLEWERAPVLPIYRWFNPELILPLPQKLDDRQLHQLLWETIDRLYDERIVLEFTDHLSDRQLYCLILRDLLPSPEKRIARQNTYIHWHCLDAEEDPDTWLRYYASPHERAVWAAEHGPTLPPAEKPPYPRRLPPKRT